MVACCPTCRNAAHKGMGTVRVSMDELFVKNGNQVTSQLILRDSLLQLINGVTFVAEGVMQGHQAFFPLALNAFVASAGLVASLNLFGHTLPGVWCGFGVFNSIRFLGAMRHHLVTGPLGSRHIDQAPRPAH